MVLDISEKDQALFEGGIKLGGIFHQFVGTPVSMDSKGSLEKAIEEAAMNQPFVEDVSVKIGESSFEDNTNKFDYLSLTGEMLDVRVIVKVGKVRVTCRMEYKETLKYPVMFVDSIEP